MPVSLEKMPLPICKKIATNFNEALEFHFYKFASFKICKPPKYSSTKDTYLLLGVEYLEVCKVSGSRVYGVIVAVIYFTPAATLFVGIIVIYFIFCAYCPNLTF